jgi:hypothetical protein
VFLPCGSRAARTALPVACSCIGLQGWPQTLTFNRCSILTDCLHVTDADFVPKLLACWMEECMPLVECLDYCYSFYARSARNLRVTYVKLMRVRSHVSFPKLINDD